MCIRDRCRIKRGEERKGTLRSAIGSDQRSSRARGASSPRSRGADERRGDGGIAVPSASSRAEHNSWTAGWKVGLHAARRPYHRNLNGDISIRTRRRGVVRGSVRHKRATAPHPACPSLRQQGTTTRTPAMRVAVIMKGVFCVGRRVFIDSGVSHCADFARATQSFTCLSRAGPGVRAL
ncbi:hypothetical protein DBV15_08063 [Temnothorax longispinosus]|uniref:Uncharacterized protein n=1 Tax=Temnothorax longispinosus TaxID=300112 RepID=A0A4S2JMG2_9HYME|nr:hypothetical protein DBV15_08063 [Temnothorax longispinosus]